MASVNPLIKEINLKIVYYGPGLGGKTTTLQHIHKTTEESLKGRLVSLATPVDRTLYFDFLPVQLPKIGEYTLRLQLFTVPGQVHFNATRKLVLTNSDGVVFVADSQINRLDANIESLENLRTNLAENNIEMDGFPVVIQYNKRDLEDILSIDELEEELNPDQRPSLGTCATRGDGVYSGLERITKEVLRDLRRRDILARQDRPIRQRMEEHIAFSEDEQGGLTSQVREFSEQKTPFYEMKPIEMGRGEREASVPPPSEELIRKSETGGIEREASVPPPSEEFIRKSETGGVAQKVAQSALSTKFSRETVVADPDETDQRPTLPAPSIPTAVVKMGRDDNSPVMNMGRAQNGTENGSDRPTVGVTGREFAPSNLSFTLLWPQSSRDRARIIETAITDGPEVNGLQLVMDELEQLISRVRANKPEYSKDDVLKSLGLNGREYLRLASISRAASETRPVEKEIVLRAYLLLVYAINRA